jgi:hypothetical protein
MNTMDAYHLAFLCSTKDLATMVLHLSAAEFLQLGLVLAGFDEGGCQERTRVESNL